MTVSRWKTVRRRNRANVLSRRLKTDSGVDLAMSAGKL